MTIKRELELMASPTHLSIDRPVGVKAQKEKERKFRERDIPFGEHVSLHRHQAFNVIELQNVLNFLSIEDGEDIFDIGCSDGRFLGYLHSKYPRCRLFGIDFAVNPLRKLREKTFTTHCACADICDLPFQKESLTRAVSIQVIHHIPSISERWRALRGIYDSLKPGATLVLTVLNRNTWHPMVENGVEGLLITSPELYVYLYSVAELKMELQEAGFLVNHIVGINNLPSAYLSHLGVASIPLDLFITRFLMPLSCNKGTYLLAQCRKPDQGHT